MEKQYKNKFLAWLYDAFILECVLLPLRYVLQDNHDLFSYVGLFLLLGVFILSVIYHVRWTNNTSWMSPGETMIGMKWINDGKVQTNPFGINRWLLIFLIVFNLLSTARTLEPSIISYFGLSGMTFIWFFGTLYNAIVLTGIWFLGQARKLGLILIVVAYLLMIAARYSNVFHFEMTQFSSSMWKSIYLLIANLVVGGYYFSQMRKTP